MDLLLRGCRCLYPYLYGSYMYLLSEPFWVDPFCDGDLKATASGRVLARSQRLAEVGVKDASLKHCFLENWSSIVYYSKV